MSCFMSVFKQESNPNASLCLLILDSDPNDDDYGLNDKFNS